jgi:hypothetical protein
MLLEINFASTHILSWLKPYSPFADSDQLCEQFIVVLSSILQSRYQGHWDPNYPIFGNAYRSVSRFDNILDPALLETAQSLRLSVDIFFQLLPQNFVVWVDPMSVTYRFGDYGYPSTIWSQKAQVSPYIPKKSSPLRISAPPKAQQNIKGSSRLALSEPPEYEALQEGDDKSDSTLMDPQQVVYHHHLST